MRYLTIILVIFLWGCGESIPPPDTDKTEPLPVEVVEEVEVVEVEEPVEELDPIAEEKDEIKENTYQVVEASKLKGLQSIKYDLFFKSAMSWYMPQIDWRWLKAQCWQESRFNPKAVSPVGAGGVCQFMPGTFDGVPESVKQGRDVWDARTNIEAGAWYMNTRYNFWTSPRPQLDRIWLAQACYNAGCGHVLNAQKACGNPSGYNDIIKCLPQITGHHSKETISYVKLIDGFRKELGVADPISY
tara:strand:- start:2994 stop:3725 length:732 start_codon:yes stop_codon:yes gene_type:complete